jgi:uncharacterized protein
MARLSLMADGFGGGTRIATSLKTFNDRYATETLNSRSVVIVMSDGYDTDSPEALAVELNPLLGWKGYAPVACAMASRSITSTALRPPTRWRAWQLSRTSSRVSD